MLSDPSGVRHSDDHSHLVKKLAMMLPRHNSASAFHAPGHFSPRRNFQKPKTQMHARPRMATATLPRIETPATQIYEPFPSSAAAAKAAAQATVKAAAAKASAKAARAANTMERTKRDLQTKIDKPAPETTSELMARFTPLFCGHFDNFNQFVEDKLAGREKFDAHEHIHCHLQRLPADAIRRAEDPPDTQYVYSNYYFEGQPEKIFRERIYVLQPHEADEQFGMCIQMQIRRIRPEMVTALRESGSNASRVTWSEADVDESLSIPNSDLFWRWQEEARDGTRSGFDGRMRNETVLVHSPIRNVDIIVKDDLALIEGSPDGKGDALWCNDRGSDTNGNHIFGNMYDIPYKMQRVGPDDWTVAEAAEQ